MVGIATENTVAGRLPQTTQAKDAKSPAIRGNALRINLLLPDRSAERLENLKKITEASSYAEVIRNAIRLYEAIIMEYEKGNKVQIIDKDGNPSGVSIF